MRTTSVDSTTAGLLHSAVHNLKGPAARLRLLAQLLGRSEAALNEEDRRALKHIEDSAAEVGAVAEGLKTYAEICARPLRREPVDLGVLAAGAAGALAGEIQSSGARVTQSALPTTPADRFLVTWLFQELLSNAIRFRAGRAPEIHISCAAGGRGNWYVACTDNGPGIDAGMEERVFLPFKKLAASPGAGLGLTICRRIVELHGGEMWAEPREGGAEFRFSLGGEDGGA